MGDRESNVYKAKLAEQAERYEGKRSILIAFGVCLGLSELPICSHVKWVTNLYDRQTYPSANMPYMTFSDGFLANFPLNLPLEL